jgi:hypothetical protein
MKVKSHVGIQENMVADRLAGEATDRSLCDQQVTVGNDGLKNIFWPTNVVQLATQNHPAVSWQLGNLSHDVKKTVAPLCQTGLTISTVYVKAWRDIHPHTLPEASNTFFTSSNVTNAFFLKRRTL